MPDDYERLRDTLIAERIIVLDEQSKNYTPALGMRSINRIHAVTKAINQIELERRVREKE